MNLYSTHFTQRRLWVWRCGFQYILQFHFLSIFLLIVDVFR